MGWNLIGNSTGSTLALPTGFVGFVWTGTEYQSRTTLDPGQGAWVSADQAGAIDLEPVEP